MKTHRLSISLLSLVLLPGLCWSTDSVYKPSYKAVPGIPENASGETFHGYCIIQFDVSVVGSVLNPSVMECRPKGVFEEASVAAIREFRYKPRVVNGEAVIVEGVLHKFLFPPERELERSHGLPVDIDIEIDIPKN